MSPQHLLQVSQLSQNAQKLLSVTQILRYLLYYQLRSWKDARQCGRVLSRWTCDHVCGSLRVLLVALFVTGQAARLPVRGYFCAFQVDLTWDADRHVCYNFSGGGGGGDKAYSKFLHDCLKNKLLSCRLPVFNTFLYFIPSKFYASYGKAMLLPLPLPLPPLKL